MILKNSLNDQFWDKLLIEGGLIIIPITERSSVQEQQIPYWIRNNAKWWADDLISDEDFIQSIQYLVEKGIILI